MALSNEDLLAISRLLDTKLDARCFYRKYYIDKKPMSVIAGKLQMSEATVRMKYVRIHKK